jgi:hypothetical protein
LALFQGPNNDDRREKTCIYCGRIGHWLQDCHEKKVILKLETCRHIRLEANKLHQLANIVEVENDCKEHGENEQQDTPIIELFQLAIALR